MPTARASVLTAFNAPLELRNLPLPDALEAGAMLVRTEMAGITLDRANEALALTASWQSAKCVFVPAG